MFLIQKCLGLYIESLPTFCNFGSFFFTIDLSIRKYIIINHSYNKYWWRPRSRSLCPDPGLDPGSRKPGEREQYTVTPSHAAGWVAWWRRQWREVTNWREVWKLALSFLDVIQLGYMVDCMVVVVDCWLVGTFGGWLITI